MAQVIAKLVLTLIILALPLWLTVVVWRSDINVRRLLRLDKFITEKMNQTPDWIPTYDRDAVYQNDQIVGRVEGAHIDEAAKVVTFDKITDYKLLTTLDAHILDFRSYQLRLREIENQNDAEQTITNVRCDIIGKR